MILRHLLPLDAAVGHLVADEEQVSPLAALLQAVDRGLAGHEVHGQFVGLGLLPAAAPFEPELGEVFVDLDARLELADLQRRRGRRWRRRCRR